MRERENKMWRGEIKDYEEKYKAHKPKEKIEG